jgi:hypothetical protein
MGTEVRKYFTQKKGRTWDEDEELWGDRGRWRSFIVE